MSPTPEACQTRRGPAARRGGRRSRAIRRLFAALALLPALSYTPLQAQGVATVRDGLRLGLVLGGSGLVGLSAEYLWEETSVDLTVGTLAFRDMTVALAAKQYFGAGSLRPFVGGGVWWVAGFQEQRSGMALLLHAPVGIDWRMSGEHYLGFAINVNRGIGVRRDDPEDDRPLAKRLVPLPGFYYRWLAGDVEPRR